MSLILSIALTLLFLGLPFYWGTLGHHGFALPLVWAVVVAVLVSLRHWRHLDWHVLYSFALTLVVSLIVCTSVFEVGRFLGGQMVGH